MKFPNDLVLEMRAILEVFRSDDPAAWVRLTGLASKLIYPQLASIGLAHLVADIIDLVVPGFPAHGFDQPENAIDWLIQKASKVSDVALRQTSSLTNSLERGARIQAARF